MTHINNESQLNTESQYPHSDENEQQTHQHKLLQATNDVAAILLQSDPDEFEQDLWRCMDMMARAVDADRMHIWRNHTHNGELYCSQLYEWSENAEPQQDNEYTTGISYSKSIPGWEEQLSGGKCVNGIVSQMTQAEQNQLNPQGIVSILEVPVFFKDHFWGFVGFDDCRRERVFSESDEIILRSTALLFANALLRNSATESMRTSAAQMEAVLSNYGGLIWSVDRGMNITLFNGMVLKKLGVPPSMFEGKNVSVATARGRHIDVYERIKMTFEEGVQDWVNEIDGGYYHHHTTPVLDSDGTVMCVVGSSEDISDVISLQKDLEKAVEAAQAASRAKSNFLSNMSHEMRTPMNAIIGMMSIGRAASTIERKDYSFDKIGEASTHLLGVINDILDMSKIEADKFELSVVVFSFGKLLQNTVNVLSIRADERSQHISTVIDPDIPGLLIGDDQRLTQVVSNLLSNALKFSPPGGSVKLEARLLTCDDDNCTIQVDVSDNGIGITPEQQSRLFSAFEQAESSTTRKYGGTGLGLAICKRIINIMGGTIGVESEVGVGSTFSFIVPLEISHKAHNEVENEASAAGVDNAHVAGMDNERTAVTDKHLTGANKYHAETDKYPSKPLPPSAAVAYTQDCASVDIETDAVNRKQPQTAFPGKHILLAEDIEINREIVLSLLEETCLTFDCAENGVEAVRLFSEAPGKYDLIFMDVQMPVLDGLDATRQIRALEHTNAKSIPIIAMTANVFREDIEKCLDAGMNAHVGKPLIISEVMVQLQRYIKI